MLFGRCVLRFSRPNPDIDPHREPVIGGKVPVERAELPAGLVEDVDDMRVVASDQNFRHTVSGHVAAGNAIILKQNLAPFLSGRFPDLNLGDFPMIISSRIPSGSVRRAC